MDTTAMNASTHELLRALPDGPFIAVCGRQDDADAWRDLLGANRCLALALDNALPNATHRAVRGASQQVARYHDLIAGLDGSGWMTEAANAFDPGRRATLVLPDPLDPPRTGDRRRLGARHPSWRLGEDKTVVDALWDSLAVPRAASIIVDGPSNLATAGAEVDLGAGVVCACQRTGAGPTAGADGMWWWRGTDPPSALSILQAGSYRARVMPMLDGTPVRLHGFVLDRHVVPFPPMEVVTLLRPASGTFLCTGAVPTLADMAELATMTRHLGDGLRERLGFRGGFSVDGILTHAGFRPTDFNARLTSAMEAVPSHLRVQLHLANMLARDHRDVETGTVERLAGEIFTASSTYTLYAAASRIDENGPRAATVQWNDRQLTLAEAGTGDGRLAVTRSPRGWLLTATLKSDRLPPGRLLGPAAPTVFALSDEVLGTDFGDLRSQVAEEHHRYLPAQRSSPDNVHPRR
ncbi:hypothetical protein AB0H83_40275 [Dactylosporangium sp. NPDC050688]|uniref:hypothetical protein n=1 Tax=Dactylosporangium sp. NPDC050688 TaxID=3157217 RepID=UPI0033FFF7C6